MYRVFLYEHKDDMDVALINHMIRLLPDERRHKAKRYKQSIDKMNCVISYIMLKTALTECFDIYKFTLGYGDYGKPYLLEYPNIHFNISHCKLGCVVAVADFPIGVDIEAVGSYSEDILHRVLCKEEMDYLKSCHHSVRAFTRLWTMKESYFKMKGTGISDDINKINILDKGEFKVIDNHNYIISICFGE